MCPGASPANRAQQEHTHLLKEASHWRLAEVRAVHIATSHAIVEYCTHSLARSHTHTTILQWELQIKNTLEQPLLSFVRRLSSLGGLECMYGDFREEIFWDLKLCP